MPTITSVLFALSGYWATIMAFVFRFPVLGTALDIATAILASALRWPVNTYSVVNKKAARPEKMLELYEYEGCPFCRKVREALTQLDLDALIYPCPRETLKQYGVCKDSRFRGVVEKRGGKNMFPYLVDPNTGVEMYESRDIVNYLYKTYGGGASPPFVQRVLTSYLPAPINSLSLFISSLLRPLPDLGILRIPSKYPKQPLELTSFEGHPLARMCREKLISLELPFILHNAPFCTAKKGDKVPTLRDPNTGYVSSNALAIIEYLLAEYKAGDMVKESWTDYSTKGASKSHGTIHKRD